MTEPTGPAAGPPPTPAPVMLDADQACIRCAYNLRGLPMAGRCPECGTPVADSLRGSLLQYAGPEYLATIHRGLILVLGAILASVASLFLAIFLGVILAGTTAPALLNSGIGFLISLVSILGYWWFTVPDPLFAGVHKPDNARRVTRAAILVQAAGTLVSFMVEFSGRAGGLGPVAATGRFAVKDLGTAAWLASLVAFAVQFFAVMLYTRWLARRVPDAYLVERAELYLRLLPLLSIIGACALGLGPIISLVLYWMLLNRLRLHLVSIRFRGAPARLRGVGRRPAPRPVSARATGPG